jgi:hypothetical protein
MSENITVTGTDSTLGLTIGATPVLASYVSNTATTITYSYTVLAGQTDTDGITVGAITLNTTTVRDAATNDANMALAGVGSTANVFVDTTAPTIVSVTSSAMDGSYNLGELIDVTVTFSENVTLAGGDLEVQLNSGLSAIVTISPIVNSNTASGIYTVAALEDSALLNAVAPLTLTAGTLVDAAGNNADLSTIPVNISASSNIIIDTTDPTVTSVAVPGAGSYYTGTSIDFTVNFDENIIVTNSTSTLELTIGAVARNATQFSVSPTTIVYRYTIVIGDLDADGIAVGGVTLNTTTVRDTAGNNADMTLNGVGSTAALLVNSP